MSTRQLPSANGRPPDTTEPGAKPLIIIHPPPAVPRSDTLSESGSSPSWVTASTLANRGGGVLAGSSATGPGRSTGVAISGRSLEGFWVGGDRNLGATITVTAAAMAATAMVVNTLTTP